MKKKKSLKLFFAALWKGICKPFRALGRLLGIKEGCTYTRVVWRLAGVVIATLVLIVSSALLFTFIDDVVYPNWIRPIFAETEYRTTNLSNQIAYRYAYGSGKGQVYDKEQKKVLVDNITWLYRTEDSLVVFAKDNLRGYFNRFTGEVVVQPTYQRAWVFSEGLAAVEKDGELLFINHQGDVVIDKDLEVVNGDFEYVFHDGYCKIQKQLNGMEGLIDHEGNYALLPEYNQIWNEHGLWKVQNNDGYGLFSASMDTLFTPDKTDITVWEHMVEVRFKNHIAQQFDHAGNLINDFVIDEINNIKYATNELYSPEDSEAYCNDEIYAVADCKVYVVRSNYTDYCGLMGRDGRRITPPEYTSINAIAKDLYLCQPHGIVINSQGKKIE